MTARVRLLGGLLFLLALLALASANGKVLALALPLVVYLGAGILARPQPPRLAVTRTLRATRASPDVPVQVTVTVLNEGPGIEELLLIDEAPPSPSRVEGSPRYFCSLSPHERIEWEYAVSAKRGEHGWGSVLVQARGHCELLGRHERREITSRLLVLPLVERLPRIRLWPRQTRGFAGPIPARTAGSGVSFHGVRDYRMGDPLRWINWRLSSRSADALITNEFEQERIADVGIVLDARGRSYPEDPRGTLFESAVVAAGSLGDLFLSEGNRIALLVYGHSWERVHPGYGKVQRQRIREQLARARTGTNYALQSLEHLPTRMFPARSQIVVVSPLQPNDASVLMAMRSEGYALLVVSPDPISEETQRRARELKGGAGTTLRMALRIAQLERSLLFATLRRAGIIVIDWAFGAPLGALLGRSLARQPLTQFVAGRQR